MESRTAGEAEGRGVTAAAKRMAGRLGKARQAMRAALIELELASAAHALGRPPRYHEGYSDGYMDALADLENRFSVKARSQKR